MTDVDELLAKARAADDALDAAYWIGQARDAGADRERVDAVREEVGA